MKRYNAEDIRPVHLWLDGEYVADDALAFESALESGQEYTPGLDASVSARLPQGRVLMIVDSVDYPEADIITEWREGLVYWEWRT